MNTTRLNANIIPISKIHNLLTVNFVYCGCKCGGVVWNISFPAVI